MKSLDKALGLLDVFAGGAGVVGGGPDPLLRRVGVELLPVHPGAPQGGTARAGGERFLHARTRILEFDRTTRLCDPVYVAGGPAMRRPADETGYSVILCILYSDSVMCVREALARCARELFSRGQKRRSSAARPRNRSSPGCRRTSTKSLFAKHRRTIAAAGLGADWDAFRKTLRQIREDGYCITSGEFNPGIVAIGAPLFNRAGDVLGSLSLAASTRRQHGEVPRTDGEGGAGSGARRPNASPRRRT